MLSILPQIYTLPTLRDDLTVLQHHPYQIQRLENRTNSSYLAKREGAVATLYWDSSGPIKAIFNMDINSEVAQIFENSGVNLAQSVLAQCRQYMEGPFSPAFIYLAGAAWAAQLGRHWRNILQRPSGVTTIAILITLRPRWRTPSYLAVVVYELQKWSSQGGNSVIVRHVQNAQSAGNAPGNQFTDGSSIKEEQTVGDHSKTRFCRSPIQNSPFVFTVHALDSLLTPHITC